MKRIVPGILVLGAVLLVSGFGGAGAGGESTKASACPKAWRAGWQLLADRIQAPVYCPSWLPAPLTGEIGGPYAALSLDADRSYLVTFLDQHEGLEMHVTMRGYPGQTEVPVCRHVELVRGKKIEKQVPCFAGRRGTKRVPGITAVVYTVNQDADEGHVLYAWRYRDSLYTLAHHAEHSLTRRVAVWNLDRMLRSFARVEPRR